MYLKLKHILHSLKLLFVPVGGSVASALSILSDASGRKFSLPEKPQRPQWHQHVRQEASHLAVNSSKLSS